ncbi:hypothetical protein VE04_08803, partial [Pseudogymnoascus sp. 24MN13]
MAPPYRARLRVPEPQVIQRRQEIAARIGAGIKPVRVRKMSEDEGEMFFGEYWGFEARGEEGGDVLRREYESEDEISRVNSSAAFSFRPAFAIHEAESSSPRGLSEAQALHHRAPRALSALLKRAFQCPTGTTAWTTISQPNYCCASTESCITITDTGLGPVGCCPSGQSCEGEITHCAAGQTACPQSLGGACCVAGFVCFDVGRPGEADGDEHAGTRTTTTPSTSAATTARGAAPPVRGTGESSTVAPPTTSLTSDSEACPTGFYACSA